MSVFEWRGPSTVMTRASSSDAKWRNRGKNIYGQTGAPIDLQALAEYRATGKTYLQCGHAFGVDESTAYRRLRTFYQQQKDGRK